jgi:release factor glutamine methyltransferase
MQIAVWLKNAEETLKNSAVETARLDIEVLLADELNKDRSWLAAHSDENLELDKINKLNKKIYRRAKSEPLAYIRKKQEFYGREFYVDKTVLVPRPESEAIIELFNELDIPSGSVVGDVGCGSGVLGITAWLESSSILVKFLDIDETVFAVAKMNAREYNLRDQQYYQGNLLDAWPDKYDVLLCNLPYVPENYAVNEAAKYEPKVALFSGIDGLDHFRSLFLQLSSGLYGSPSVISESLPEQHEALKIIAARAGYSCRATKDFAQLFQK